MQKQRLSLDIIKLIKIPKKAIAENGRRHEEFIWVNPNALSILKF